MSIPIGALMLMSLVIFLVGVIVGDRISNKWREQDDNRDYDED